ncbi:hypothetical protein GCM10028814_20490 [Angustibacter aerolatus]
MNATVVETPTRARRTVHLARTSWITTLHGSFGMWTNYGSPLILVAPVPLLAVIWLATVAERHGSGIRLLSRIVSFLVLLAAVSAFVYSMTQLVLYPLQPDE